VAVPAEAEEARRAEQTASEAQERGGEREKRKNDPKLQ
jgi:hypothetical protein